LLEIREKLEPLFQEQCPFPVEPKTNAPATWVKPRLVCEVALSGWTNEAVMRHPVFLRLREDKTAGEVRREVAPQNVDSMEVDEMNTGMNTMHNHERISKPKRERGGLYDT
jgi:bifunctional non-homologous end joining protein LigD